MTTKRDSQTIRFVSELWPDGLPAGYAMPCVAMGRLKAKAGQFAVFFAQEALKAAEWLEQASQRGDDAYVQAGAIRSARADELSGLPGSKRGGSADVSIVPGFYVDLDVGPGKFADIDAAVKFARTALPMRPAMLVGSGGGVHAWWLFEESETLLDDREHRAMEARIHGWSLVARQAAQSIGVKVDAVWDLARIGRVPGTVNYKTGEPRPVTMIESGGKRINPSDLDLFSVEPSRATVGQGSVIERMGGVVLDADRGVRVDRFDAMMANVDGFKATWEHKRRDMIDPSNSGYDMALATTAAMAGWTPQEIVDLIVSHRRKWASASTAHERDPLKLKNPGYYVSTVAKAIETAEKSREREVVEAREEIAAEELRELTNATNSDESSDEFTAAQARRRVKEFFKKHLSIEIDRAERYGGSDKSSYKCWIDGGEAISFSSFKEFSDWNAWRAYARERRRVTVAAKRPKGWDEAVDAVNRFIVNDEKGSGNLDGLTEYLFALWSGAGDTQRADANREGDSVIKRRTTALSAWGWFREGDSILVSVSMFLAQMSEHPLVKPFRERRSFVGALKGLGADRLTVAIQGSTVSVYRITFDLGPSHIRAGEEEGESDLGELSRG